MAGTINQVEHVRTRPGMYIGGLNSRGLHQMVWELVDAGLREAAAGFATTVTVTIHSDNSCTVADDGRGVAVGVRSETGVPVVESVFGALDAGGISRDDAARSYGRGPGLSGVGAAVVNYLSESFDVEVRRDGAVHLMRFVRGIRSQPLTVGGPAERTGTRITFRPDGSLFKSLAFRRSTLVHRLRELAALHGGATIAFADERAGSHDVFRFHAGVADYVQHLAQGRPSITDVVAFVQSNPARGVAVDCAVQYVEGTARIVLSFVNDGIATRGTHLRGFYRGLNKAFAVWLARSGANARPTSDHGGAPQRGLVAILSIRISDPTWGRATADELLNGDVDGVVCASVAEHLTRYLDIHPVQAHRLLASVVRDH